MNGHVTGEQLVRLRDGMLPPAEVAAVGSHAAVCGTCARAVSEAVSVQRLMRDVRVQIEADDDVEHLSEDVLMALADDALFGTERERARAHVAECGQCRADVDDLRRLRFSVGPKRSWQWGAIAVAAALVALILLPLLYERPHPAPPPAVRPPVKRVVVPPPVSGYGVKEWDALVARARTTNVLEQPAILEQLRTPKTTLRGSEREDDLELQPNRSVVLGVRPRFQWRARGGATYKVLLQNGESVVESESLKEPHWTPTFDLKRGREYAWQVEVATEDARTVYPIVPEAAARFVVLDEKGANEIEDAQARLPNDALLHAVLFAHSGLRDETNAALDRLKRTDPALASALRKSVQSWR
jgi:anti-sigma factor RsiW